MANILIVEDDTLTAKLLSIRLEHSGHTILWAHDGNQGISRAHALAPDLILLDVTLPGMNGLEVLKHLKQSRTTHDIPVMMLTAQTDGTSVLTGLDRGADAYLTKPFDFQDLLRRVETLLERSHVCQNVVPPDAEWLVYRSVGLANPAQDVLSVV
jgi:DNA-binding response OmpR family regulator